MLRPKPHGAIADAPLADKEKAGPTVCQVGGPKTLQQVRRFALGAAEPRPRGVAAEPVVLRDVAAS